jgi:hypothetical protein
MLSKQMITLIIVAVCWHCTWTEHGEVCHWGFVALDQDRDNIGKLYGLISNLRPYLRPYTAPVLTYRATYVAGAACCDEPDSPPDETFRTASAADAAEFLPHQQMPTAASDNRCSVSASGLMRSHSFGHLMAGHQLNNPTDGWTRVRPGSLPPGKKTTTELNPTYA